MVLNFVSMDCILMFGNKLGTYGIEKNDCLSFFKPHKVILYKLLI